MATFRFGAHLTHDAKIFTLWRTEKDDTRSMGTALILYPAAEPHVGKPFFSALFNDMAVKALRGGYVGASQLLGGRYHIGAVGDEHGRNSVP